MTTIYPTVFQRMTTYNEATDRSPCIEGIRETDGFPWLLLYFTPAPLAYLNQSKGWLPAFI